MRKQLFTLAFLALFFTVHSLGAQSVDRTSVEKTTGDTVKIGNLEWINPVDRALTKAKKQDKPVLMLRVLGHLSGEI